MRSSPRFAPWARRCKAPPFPGHHGHQDLRGQIAIGAKRPHQAVRLLPGREERECGGPLRGNLWAARRERSRQNHHHQDALRPDRTDQRPRCNWPARRAMCGHRLSAAASATCRRSSPFTTTSPLAKIWISSPASMACRPSEREEKKRWVMAFLGPGRQDGSDHGQSSRGLETAGRVRVRHYARTRRFCFWTNPPRAWTRWPAGHSGA